MEVREWLGLEGDGELGFRNPWGDPSNSEGDKETRGGFRQNQHRVRGWRKLFILTVFCLKLKGVSVNVTFCLVSESAGSRPLWQAKLGTNTGTRL